MSNIHRVLWFDRQIRQNRYPNSKTLATEFEISVRQAARDIEYLTDTLGAPLQYVAKRRGYEYKSATYVLPNLYISQDVKRVLQFLAYRYEHYQLDQYEHSVQNRTIKRVAGLFRQMIDGSGDESSILLFDLDPHRIETICVVEDCIKSGQQMRLVYDEVDGKTTEHMVSPIALFYRYNVDYLSANLHMEGTTVFRIDRIRSVIPTCTTEVVPTKPSTDVVNPSSIKPFVARIDFSKEAKGNPWTTYSFTHIADNVYDIEFFDPDAFINQLLTHSWARIISPNWLKERLRAQCEAKIKCLE